MAYRIGHTRGSVSRLSRSPASKKTRAKVLDAGGVRYDPKSLPGRVTTKTGKDC